MKSWTVLKACSRSEGIRCCSVFFIYEVLKCSKLPWQIVTELPYLLEGAGVVEKRGRSEVRADLPSKEIIIEESFNVSFGLVGDLYLLHDFHPNWLLQKVFFFFVLTTCACNR